MLKQKAENPCHQDGSKERRQRHAYRGNEQCQLVEELGVDYSRQDAKPKTIAMEMETAASSKVFGKASPKMSETLRLLWYDMRK